MRLLLWSGITLGFILSKTYNYLTRNESDVSFSDLSSGAIVNKYQSLFNEDISNNAAVLKQLADIEKDALNAGNIVNVEDFREGGPRRDELRRIAGRTATLARTEQIIEDPLGYATLDDLPEPKNFLDRLKNFFIRTNAKTIWWTIHHSCTVG